MASFLELMLSNWLYTSLRYIIEHASWLIKLEFLKISIQLFHLDLNSEYLYVQSDWFKLTNFKSNSDITVKLRN